MPKPSAGFPGDGALPESLVGMLALSGEIFKIGRNGALPNKPAWVRRFIQPIFFKMGALTAAVFEALSPMRAAAVQDAIFSRLAGRYQRPFDRSCPALIRARKAIAQVEKDAGRPAALLALVSHAPVTNGMAALNIELVRQAALALRFLRGDSCRPRLVVAVDSFALDTLAFWEEGLYTGFMGFYHVGLDRTIPQERSAALKRLPSAAPDRMVWRFSRDLLKDGGEFAMVLSGGVPATSRSLYALREWLVQIRKNRGAASVSEIIGRMRKDEDFCDFESLFDPRSRIRRSAWRLLEGWCVAHVLGVWPRGEKNTQPDAETGSLSARTLAALTGVLAAFGFDEPSRRTELELLKDEFLRETPYRKRLFRFLARRVLRAGRAVAFIPITHNSNDPVGIRYGECWVWRGLENGSLSAFCAGATADAWRGTPDEFATRFAPDNFA
ncbi:MAG: hypothetical protein ACYCPQ_09995 [Elusimicrobiota bacterium]